MVDADSCPVREIIVKVAGRYGLPVIMFIDTSHVIDDGYSEVVTVDKGRDSVDIALINRAAQGDIIVTGDYGVAALALARGAFPLHHKGHVIDSWNIEQHLNERHLSGKIRRSGGRTTNPRARTKEDDRRFEEAFNSLCADAQEGRPSREIR